MINQFRTRFMFEENDGAGGSAPEPLEQEATQQQQPAGLTRDDMAEFAQTIVGGITQGLTPPQAEEEDEIPEGITYDPDALKQFVGNQVNKAVQQARIEFQQQLQAQMGTIAPIVANQQAAAITQGLPPVAAEYVTQQLSQYNPAQIAAISADPNMKEMLRLAAQGYAVSKAGVPIPGMTPTPGAAVDTVDQTEVARVMQSLGLSKEDALEIVKGATA